MTLNVVFYNCRIKLHTYSFLQIEGQPLWGDGNGIRCGSSLPLPIAVDSNLKLTFVTDGNPSNHGFELSYYRSDPGESSLF